MPEVKLKFEQAQIHGKGQAVLWMCNPEHEHLAYSMMHHNLWWILKEALDVDPGRVRFYELGAFQSPQCEHVSWCNDPDEIVAAMNGEMTVSSTLGEGSTFRITLQNVKVGHLPGKDDGAKAVKMHAASPRGEARKANAMSS